MAALLLADKAQQCIVDALPAVTKSATVLIGLRMRWVNCSSRIAMVHEFFGPTLCHQPELISAAAKIPTAVTFTFTRAGGTLEVDQRREPGPEG